MNIREPGYEDLHLGEGPMYPPTQDAKKLIFGKEKWSVFVVKNSAVDFQKYHGAVH